MSELYSSASGSYETYLSERQVDKITTTIKQQTDFQVAGMAATTVVLGSKLDSMNAKLSVIGTGLYTAVSRNTLQIAASASMLEKSFNEGFDAVNNRLDLGFAGITSAIGAMNAAMTAGFDQMRVSLDYWGNEICDKLDAIHDIVNNPLLTASRELYRRAVANAKKQFFEEALEDIKGAVEKNKTDYISWGLMGRIYLFGVSEFSNTVDVQKGLEAFTNACKYISPDTAESKEAKKMASEYYFYAAFANYILANESRLANKTEDVKKYLEESVKTNSKSFALSDTMLEAVYDKARAYSLLEQKENALKTLEEAIRADGLYSVKALGDPDFKWLENDIVTLITTLRNELQEKTKILISELTNDYEFIGGEYCEKIKGLLSKIKELSESDKPYLDVRAGYGAFYKEFEKIKKSKHPMDLLVYENGLRKDFFKDVNGKFIEAKNGKKIEGYYFENKLEEMFTTTINSGIDTQKYILQKLRESVLRNLLTTPYYDRGESLDLIFRYVKVQKNQMFFSMDYVPYRLKTLGYNKDGAVVDREDFGHDKYKFDNYVKSNGNNIYYPNLSYVFLQSKYGEKGSLGLTDNGYTTEAEMKMELSYDKKEYNLYVYFHESKDEFKETSFDDKRIMKWQIDKNTIILFEEKKRLAVYQRGIISKKDLSDYQTSMDSLINDINQKRENLKKMKDEKEKEKIEEVKRQQEARNAEEKKKTTKIAIIVGIIVLIILIILGRR